MKFLLFDQNAISAYVSEIKLQSIEYLEGARLVEHFQGKHSSELFLNSYIEYQKDGILFVGPRKQKSVEDNKHIFCIDLTTCKLFDEERNASRILTVMQKAFRLVLKIWNVHPFSASERINGTKSILFPFSMGDRHRLVIERSNIVPRFETRGISFPLLAYKYNAEEPGQMVEIADTAILRLSGELYAQKRHVIQAKLEAGETGEAFP